LSLIAGSLNLIPILGPIVSGILILLVALLFSFQKALFSLLAFILIQQIDGNILGPILTRKFVGLSPFLTLVSLLIGGKILGIWGAIFAIPLTAVIIELGKEIFQKEI
jgi:predicted PurR-regulated permease PerM